MKCALKVGLTGGIGSGKSTAARCFTELDIMVIDADSVAHELVRPGKPVLARIQSTFGHSMVDDKGKLDRVRLRHLIFKYPEKRRQLENLLHPLIRKQMETAAKACTRPYCVLCIPLLVESQQQDLVDRVLLIDVPTELQIQRVKQRDNLPESEIRLILNAQAARDVRRAAAHDIIDNTGDLPYLKRQIDRLHCKYMEMASAA